MSSMITSLVKQALQSLLAHPARSFLTMLGVIIGINSVIMFISLGEGLKADIKQEITSLGSNILFVLPGQFDGNNPQNAGSNIISGDILKMDDVTDLEKADFVDEVGPMMLVGGVMRKDTLTVPSAMLMGSLPNLPDLLATIKIKEGEFFNEEQNLKKDNVLVVGQKIADNLFPNQSSIGQKISIGKEEFTIIGTFDTPDSTSILGGSEYGNMVVMPIETAGKIAGGVKIFRIIIKLKPEVDTASMIEPTKQILLARHVEEDFTVLTQEDILSFLDTILGILTTAVGAIAAISLVVAGIGIMNIMLVAVTERTREIGLRKAVGATNGAILLQFLIEAVMLTAIGALIAIIIAFAATYLIDQVTPLHPIITSGAIMLAVGVSIVVGLVFGIAPAMRAARLDPIQALRYE